MTHHEHQLRSAFRKSGLALQGYSFEKAVSVPVIRIALECAVKASIKGKPAPVQPELI